MNPRITGAVPVCFLLFTAEAVAQDVIDVAARLIGRPYVWGAEGPNSFDCSGLTQYVYQQFGVELPRRAINQSRIGDAAGRRLRRGDLLFFSTDTRKSEVTHVGLYEGDGVMIDASKRHGRVRRDDLSDGTGLSDSCSRDGSTALPWSRGGRNGGTMAKRVSHDHPTPSERRQSGS